MPHLRLEVSANAAAGMDWQALFQDMHAVLHEQGGIKLDNCKSRVAVLDDYRVGDGSEAGAFAHLDVRFMSGRPGELKARLGEGLRDVLVRAFATALEQREMQTTVELRDIEHAGYFKYPEGTLTPQH